MIYSKLKMKGGKFYLEAEHNGNDYSYSIKCHIEGNEHDILLHKNIKKPLEAVKQLEYYVEHYNSDVKILDIISESSLEINEYIDKYKLLLEFSKENLMKKNLKGDGGIIDLCKKWGVQYSKLSKEECINLLIETVNTEIK